MRPASARAVYAPRLKPTIRKTVARCIISGEKRIPTNDEK